MNGWYARVGKRVFDIVLAIAGVALLCPLLAIIAFGIRVDTDGPAIFRQRRAGAKGRGFTLYKFRSMAFGSPDVPSANASALVVTRVGRFIRRTNLDELPQLINVVKGDMSLVGPRPALPSQNDLLARRRASGAEALRPGLTGLAQVRSYDGMPPEEKAALDGRYAQHVTFLGDLRIIAETFRYLLRQPPVY